MNADSPNNLEIKRAQKNDVPALNTVIEKTAPYVLALCKTWCRPPLEAADIAQESLVRVAKSLNSFHHDSAFFSWVYSITYRTFLDHARKNKRRDSIAHIDNLDPHFDAILDSHQNESALNADFSEAVSNALEALGPIHRDILIMIDVQELSYNEVAQAMGLALGTVRSRVARARLNFKKNLIKQGTMSASGDVLPTEEPL